MACLHRMGTRKDGLHPAEVWLQTQLPRLYAAITSPDPSELVTLKDELLEEMRVNEKKRLDVIFPHTVVYLMGTGTIPMRHISSLGTVMRMKDLKDATEPLVIDNDDEARALTEVALEVHIRGTLPLSRGNMAARAAERIRIAEKREDYLAKIAEIKILIESLKTEKFPDSENKKVRKLLEFANEFLEMLVSNQELKLSEKIDDFFRYWSVRVVNIFSPKNSPGGAVNDDGICGLNSVVLALLSLKRLKNLCGKDQVSQAFLELLNFSVSGKLFNIDALRTSLGPGYSRIAGDQFSSIPSVFVQELADAWPGLKAATGGSGSWWDRRPAVKSLVKLRPGNLEDLIKLNGCKIDDPPEILIFEIAKFPVKLKTNLMIKYPEILKIRDKEKIINYHLRATVEAVPNHVYTIIWQEKHCVKLDNGIKTKVPREPSDLSELLFYEAEEGYVRKPIGAWRRIFAGIKTAAVCVIVAGALGLVCAKRLK